MARKISDEQLLKLMKINAYEQAVVLSKIVVVKGYQNNGLKEYSCFKTNENGDELKTVRLQWFSDDIRRSTWTVPKKKRMRQQDVMFVSEESAKDMMNRQGHSIQFCTAKSCVCTGTQETRDRKNTHVGKKNRKRRFEPTVRRIWPPVEDRRVKGTSQASGKSYRTVPHVCRRNDRRSPKSPISTLLICTFIFLLVCSR